MCFLALTVATFNLLTIGDCLPAPAAGGCPPLVTYSAEDQAHAAAEIRAGRAPTLARFNKHYGQMRDACRVGR